MRDKITRRKGLKMMASSSVIPLITGEVAAGSSGFTNEDYQKSIELRKKAGWSVEKWRKYLVRRGAKILTYDTKKPIPNWGGDKGESAGTPTTQELDQGEISLSLTYRIYDGGYNEVDFNWLIDPYGDSTTELNEKTNQPTDVVALGWSDVDYVKDGDTYFDSYGGHLSHQNSTTPTGVAVDWNDAAAGLDAAQNGQSTVEGFFGVPIQPRSSSYKDERKIYFDYYHRWLAGRITNISFGSSGPSVSFSYETQSWVKEDDEYEKDCDIYIGGP